MRKLSIVSWRYPSTSTARYVNSDALPMLWKNLARCPRLESVEFDACFLEDRYLMQDFLKIRPASLKRMTAITLDALPPAPVLYRPTLPDNWDGKCFVWHEVEECIWTETTRRSQWNWYTPHVRRGFVETAARKVDFVRQGGDEDARGTKLDSEHSTVSFRAGAFNGRERTVRILGLPSTPKERVRLAAEEFKMKKAWQTSHESSISPQIVALKKRVEAQRRSKREDDLERERVEWEEKIKARDQRLVEEKDRERKAAKKRRNRIVRSAERTAKLRLAERKRVV